MSQGKVWSRVWLDGWRGMLMLEARAAMGFGPGSWRTLMPREWRPYLRGIRGRLEKANTSDPPTAVLMLT